MIPSPLGLRLSAARPVKDQVYEAARLGAKGVLADATAELSPERLTETGRREVRHLLRTVGIDLIAIQLPTRRSFETAEQLDERLARADCAFAMAYELGSRLVLARVGTLGADQDTERRANLTQALLELARRADHRGIRFGIETGPDAGASLRAFLDALNAPTLAASVDPGALLTHGHDPAEATRALGPWVAHAYASMPDAANPAARLALRSAAGLPPGAVDWEEYLGALEEINYRGYLTIAPGPSEDPATRFQTMAELFGRF